MSSILPGFGKLTDQVQPDRFLKNILKRGTIPHALLFTGIEGTGKEDAAMKFAMACNCIGTSAANQPETSVPGNNNSADLPCGICRSCGKIFSGNHPDFLRVSPAGSIIKIAQIRDLCNTLAMRPYEAKVRVVLISCASTMNKEAANALLKVLEEPPDSTIFILTADQPSDLLPTIVSRCQHIRFSPYKRDDLVEILGNQYDLKGDVAEIYASMAGGSLKKALSISGKSDNEINWISRRTWIFSELDKLPGSSAASQLAFAEKLSGGKDLLKDSLEIMITYFRDLVIFKISPEKIFNRDRYEYIRNTSAAFSLQSLLAKIEAIQTAQKKIASNAAVRLTMDTLILKIARDI